MSTPPVTIAVNNLNDGCYLPDVLDSCRAQTKKAFEIIGIDAGSTDNSLHVYASYHVPVVHCGGMNQPRSVNRVIRQSKADFFAWINADDRYDPCFVEAHLAALAEHPEADITYSWWYTFYSDRPARPVHKTPPLNEWMPKGLNYICQCAVMIRQSLFDRIGLFDESINYPFDMEFWVRAWKEGVEFHEIPRATAGHRTRRDNLTHTKGPEIRVEMERIRKMHFPEQGQ